MSIEEDLENALKHANFSAGVDPLAMVRQLVRNMEFMMLKRMKAQIDVRISQLTPVDDSMDPFVILGVKIDSTREEVDKAYREKASKAHPDKGGTNDEMKKVNAAYETIKLFKRWK